MASGRLILDGYQPVLDANANPVPGATATVYTAGTSTPATVYSNASLTTPLTNPVTANSAGQFPGIFANSGLLYDVRIATAADAQLAYLLSVRALGAPGDVTAAQIEGAVEEVVEPLLDDKADDDLANATFLPAGSSALSRSVLTKIRQARSIGDRTGATSDAKLRAALAAGSTDEWAELLGENEPVFILTPVEIPPGIDLVGKDRTPGERYGVGNFAAEKNLMVLSPGATISYCPERSSLSGWTIITRALYDALPWANEAAALAGVAAFAGTAIKLYAQTRPGETEATATAVIDADGISVPVITNGGTGYTSAPTVSVTGGGGSGATVTATVTAGVVTALTVTNRGSGYTSAPTISFSGGGGSGAAATGGIGPVVSVTVNNGGTGYNGFAYVRFAGGGGTGATGTVASSGGVITGITVANGGSGYTAAPSAIVFIGGSDCVLENLLILGFAQAVDAEDIDRLTCVRVNGDCTNGIRTFNSFDVSNFVRCHFWPFLTVHVPAYGISTALTKREGTAFSCDGVGDWTNFSDCFSFGFDIGTDINGPSHVLCQNSSHDNFSDLAVAGRVTYGFRVRGSTTRNITLSMCRAAGQAVSLDIDMSGTLNPVCTTIGFRSWGAVLKHVNHTRGIWTDIGSQWEAVPTFEIGNNFTFADTITAANLSLTYPSNPAITASATALAKITTSIAGIGAASTTAPTDHRSTVAATEDFTGIAGGAWTVNFRGANGTAAVPTNSAVNNVPGIIKWQGYASSAFRNTASMRATISSLSGSDLRARLAVWQAVSGSEAEHTAFKPAGGLVVPRLTADPSGGEQGEIYENTTTDTLRRYNGAAWVQVGAEAPSTEVIAYPANATPGAGGTGTIVWANAVTNAGTQLNTTTGVFNATQDAYLFVSAILAVTPADATLGRLNIIAIKTGVEFARDQRVVATTNTVNLSISTWIKVAPGDTISFTYFNDRATTWVGEAAGVPISTLRIIGLRLA